MEFNDTLDELNITLGDSGDVTFTPEEKIRALRKAWNDSYVVSTVWDDSIVFNKAVADYELPDTMTSVKGIYLSSSNTTDNLPEPIDSGLWQVNGTTLTFGSKAAQIIPTGYTLHIKGNYKLAYTDDTLDTVNLQEYVIAMAGYNTLGLLGFKKANLFLKNDTSMGELITLKRDLKDDVRELRARLQRSFEAV